MAHYFTEANFTEEVLKSEKPVLVDFYADWCGPCKMMAPVIDQMAEERKDITIGKLDIEANRGVAEQYGVSSIPTLIFFRGGKEVSRVVGFQSREALENKIAAAIS